MPTVVSDDLLHDMRAGWSKIANLYAMKVYVFRLPDGNYAAVTNRAQGVGEMVETISPDADTKPAEPSRYQHGLGDQARPPSPAEPKP